MAGRDARVAAAVDRLPLAPTTARPEQMVPARSQRWGVPLLGNWVVVVGELKDAAARSVRRGDGPLPVVLGLDQRVPQRVGVALEP